MLRFIRSLFKKKHKSLVPDGWSVSQHRDPFNGRMIVTVRRLSDSTSCIVGVKDEHGASGLRYEFFDDLLKKRNGTNYYL